MKLAALGLALGLGLAGCAGWSDPDQLNMELDFARAGYTVYCAQNPAQSICNATNAKRVNDAVTAASHAIAAYADVKAHGGGWHAALAHAQELIKDVTNIVADIRSKG